MIELPWGGVAVRLLVGHMLVDLSVAATSGTFTKVARIPKKRLKPLGP